MRMLRLDEVRFGPDDVVFKENPMQAFLFTGGFAAGALLFLFLWIKGDVDAFLGIMMIAFFGGFAWYMGNVARKAARPANWLMAVNGQRVLVKFRSYLNTMHPETDPQVLEIALDEIASVQENELVIHSAGYKGKTATSRQRSLDLRLPRADLRPLAERLEVEREWKRTGMSIKDWPVAIPEENQIRVNFSANVSHVKPEVGEAVRMIATRAQARPRVSLVVDLRHPQDLLPHQRDMAVRALAHSGHYLQALQLTRDLYGVKDAEAREYVAKLEAPLPVAVTAG